MKKFIRRIFFTVLMICSVSVSASDIPMEKYKWDNVPYGGGGFVTGLVFHPLVPDLVYIRTDVGGAYRWDEENNRWWPMCDMFSQNEGNLYGIDGIAVDPNQEDVVYLCAGKYPTERAIRYDLWIDSYTDFDACEVLKSTDRGKTWKSTGLDVEFNGNGTSRQMGEMIAVDPNNSNNVYVFARDNKLYCSRDEARSWKTMQGFPEIPTEGNEEGKTAGFVRNIVIDPSSVKDGTSQIMYAGVYGGYGVYMSTDAGVTWESISGIEGPQSPTTLAVTKDGSKLYATDSAGVFVYSNGKWKNITPESKATQYRGLDIDPENENIIYVNRTTGDDGRLFNGHLYRSEDGGETWKDYFKTVEKFSTVNWWPERYFNANVSSVRVNPHNTAEVWVSDWYGVWKTHNINQSPKQAWINDIRGHEEMVMFCAISFPEGGPKLMAGNADNDGAVWLEDIEEYPSYRITNSYDITDTNELDYCESSPNIVVRASGNGSEGRYGYSMDYGKTWTLFSNFPKDSNGKPKLSGRVAVSSQINKDTGYPTVFIYPALSGGYYSRDMGETWHETSGEVENLVSGRFAWSYNYASDREEPDTFYGYANGGIYVSTDGAANFTQTVSGLPIYGRSHVRTAPGMAGTFWVALGFDGIYASNNYGQSMYKLDNVTRAYMIAFGKEAEGRTNPTAYLYGEVNGEEGIFRSVDMGASWVRINDDEHMIGCEPTAFGADRQEFGVIYVGTNGRGLSFGRPIGESIIEGEDVVISTDNAPVKEKEIEVYINGNKIEFDVLPEIVEDRVMVPIRKTAEAFGATVEWYQQSPSAMIQYKDKDIYLPLDEWWMLVNKIKVDTYYKNYMKNDRMLISLRSIAEIFEADISWDGENKAVWISVEEETENE